MFNKKLLFLLVGLFIFHLSVSSLFYFISIKGYFPSLNNEKGIWNYAKDSKGYHKKAIKILRLIKHKGFSAWFRYMPSKWHMKYIALMYYIFKPVPLAMAPLNAFLWTMNFMLVFFLSYFLLFSRIEALTTAFVFSLFPSYIMNSIQLLKEQFYILGVLLFLFGWIWVLRDFRTERKSYVKIVISMLMVTAGFYLTVANRTYLIHLWMGVAILLYVFSMWYAPKKWLFFSLLIVCIGLTYIKIEPLLAHRHPKAIKSCRKIERLAKPVSKTVHKFHWTSYSWIPAKLDSQLKSIAKHREKFVGPKYSYAGSNIDVHVHFHSARDIIHYLPRAMEIGLFAPFPNFWFEKAVTSGRVSRLLVGFEMIVIYSLYIGILFDIKNREIDSLAVFLLLWGCFFILLLSLTIANLGTLHRVRYVYFLPFFIYGIKGWASCLHNKKLGKQI